MDKISKRHIIITGSNGYIGKALVNFFAKQNSFQLSILSSRSEKNLNHKFSSYDWKLGDSFPKTINNIDKNTTLIHLAHDWNDLNDNKLNLNYTGTLKLFRTAKNSNIKNLIFSSSISSSPKAHNVYGRIKNMIEKDLDEKALILRIGVIYGGTDEGQWGIIKKLTKLPILPIFGLSNRIHAIHISDLCFNVNNIVLNNFEFQNPIYLGSSKSVTFKSFLKFVSVFYHKKNILLLPIPQILISVIVKCLEKLKIFQFLSERIKGLQKSKYYDKEITSQDNEVFVKDLDYFINKKNKLHLVKQSLIEANVLFRYLNLRKPNFSHYKLYSKKTMNKYKPYKFFYLLTCFPSLFKFIDPINKISSENINEKCFIVMLLTETQDIQNNKIKNLFKLMFTLPIEILIFPFRFLFSMFVWRKI